MKSEVKKTIEKVLEKYEEKNIQISDKQYTLYIVPEFCDEDLNIFEGFLFVEADDKNEVSYLKSRYRPPVSGYAPRIGIVLYGEHLLIKDYRKNKHLIKTITKINKTFLKKLKNALNEPKEENFTKLFDRSDVIEEFYILFKKSREYLLKNIKGISNEEDREEYVDNFMMQMLTLWYLQERGFFNNDKNYFITKFEEFKQQKLFKRFESYYEFLRYFFDKASNNLNSEYHEDEIVGKIVVIGPAVFLNGKYSEAISIPDKCFYKEGVTDILINTPPKKVSQEIPLLNLFESRDWTEGNIDEFVLGALYEKLITSQERKKTGAYYTPEEITSYICKNTIEPYLIDKINKKFNENFENIDQIIESDNKKFLINLFEQLKEIKILDPAVGSGHFLESAINVLVEIYEKIWEKAKKIGLKDELNIVATNEKGEIEKIDLVDISDEERFKLLIKFFIILSKNIYGVDINASALKIAKARLFLTLAKHFKVGKDKDIFVRFPNIHFNLREGNSLIGYTELGKEQQEGQLRFDFFVEENQSKYLTEKIKVVSELKLYLEKSAKSLNLDGNMVEEIDQLNKILARNTIYWNDFEKVLRTKEKLITILIASLNLEYAKPLHELLNDITVLFNQKLDEKFSKEFNIKLVDLKKIRTFHWVFEFPEVFLKENPGFEIVIGNPPYGDVLKESEKKISEDTLKLCNGREGSYNAAAVFIGRSFKLIQKGGFLSYIVPNTISRITEFSKIRQFILNNFTILSITKEENPFMGVHLEMDAYILRKIIKRENYFVKILDKNHKFINKVDISIFRKYNRFIYFWDELAEFVWNNSKINVLRSTRGPYVSYKEKKEGEFYNTYLYNHSSIDKYKVKKVVFIKKTGREELRNHKVLSSRNMYRIYRCIWNSEKYYPGQGIAIILNSNGSEPDKSIVPILNSKLLDYLCKRYIFNMHSKPTNLQLDVTSFTPIRINYDKSVFSILCDYMQFLSANEERRLKETEIIEFFKNQIIDSLVYELYLKEKFYEDGLYPEPKEYLLKVVSRHLKPINYEFWAKLFWKKQIYEKLENEEEKDLENLEKKNREVIKEVLNSMKKDFEINKWIEKIKFHEWIKIIEKKEEKSK